MLKTQSTFLKNNINKSFYHAKIRNIKVKATIECDQDNVSKTSRRFLYFSKLLLHYNIVYNNSFVVVKLLYLKRTCFEEF